MKKKIKVIGLIFLIVLSVPSVVSILMECSWMDIGTQKAESWMSFWGGYLGAILGIAGAVIATTIQIKSQTNQIVLAATKNDEFERNRIYTNMLIEKNVEIHKEMIEMKKVFVSYKSSLNELLNKQKKELESTYHFKSEVERILFISNLRKDRDITDDEKEYLEKLENTMNEKSVTIESIKNKVLSDISIISSLNSSINSNAIFFLQNESYADNVKRLLDIMTEEMEASKNYLIPVLFRGDVDEIIKFENERENFYDESYQEVISLIDSSYPQYSENLIRKLFTNEGATE